MEVAGNFQVSASCETYLDLLLVHVRGLETLACVEGSQGCAYRTKLLTIIFESPVPAAGPLGTVALVLVFPVLVFF